jgi:hypothetical protein
VAGGMDGLPVLGSGQNCPGTPDSFVRTRLLLRSRQRFCEVIHPRAFVMRLSPLHLLALSEEALDTPLGAHGSHRTSGVCYSALRCLPRRDLHPLEKNDRIRARARRHRHDATWR